MTNGIRYFDYVRDMLLDRSGLVITPDKIYLLEMRLLPVAHRHGYKDIDALIDDLKISHNESIAVDVVEAMNTHESLFFRDSSPFRLFQDIILSELLKRRHKSRRIRIWCAACSSGQEPYSLAMTLYDEAARLGGWKVEIIATDISNAVLSRAKEGYYTQFEVQRGLPVQNLIKHFTKEGESWRINKNIQEMVQFRQCNLMDSAYKLGTFDVVLCRNVLIYFDVGTKGKVLARIGDCMTEDGVLFLGSSESTVGITKAFLPVRAGRGIYKRSNNTISLAEPETDATIQ